MAQAGDGKKTTRRNSPAAGRAKTKKPTVTIDLVADEVPARKLDGKPDGKPEAGPAAQAAARPTAAHPAAETSEEPVKPPEPPQSAPPPTPKQASGSSTRKFILAGAVGGVVALLLGLVGQLTGLVPAPGRQASSQALERVEVAHARLDALDEATAGHANLIAEVTRAVADISLRSGDSASLESVAGVGAEIGALRDELEVRLPADLPVALDEIATRLERVEAALGAGAVGDAETPVMIAAMTDRIEQLASRLAAVSEDVAAVSEDVATVNEDVAAARQSGDDRAAGALAILALERAALGSQPFIAALDAVAATGVAVQAVADLRPLALAGVPTRAQLEADFADLADLADPSAPKTPSANGEVKAEDGVLGWFSRRLEGIVSIRSVGSARTEPAPAPWSGMAVAVAAGDLAGALEKRDGLSEEARNLTANWAEAVDRRLRTDVLVAEITAAFGSDVRASTEQKRQRQ